MKKSEKKSVVFSDEVTITSIKNDDNNDNAMPVEALPVVDDFTGLKKKKKEKKKAEESAEGDGTPATAIITDDFDFGKRKKKKKPAESSISSNGNVDADAMETRSLPSNAGSDVSIGANIVGTNKNEGGDDTNAPGEEISIGGADNKSSYLNDDGETWLGTARDYTYPELLGRVFGIIRQNNPELAGEKKRYTIAPPQVFREGTKKTVFANVGDIARRMRRTPDHLIQYLFAELGTTGSVDGQERLVIKGKFVQKQIETVLKRYIVEYVTCRNCKSADTNLTKDNRLFFLNCQSCGSTRSVSAIKTGFMAQTTKRAAARAAAQT